uniref:CSN8/PSMD8/EIF3K domain-containing protein n=1 Tax=Compsopogon caeruleus TaxID=31354 RepID=A0A7S1XF70_9RHOD|mmetsp:Transcript_331/g.572  ORF Transcript_331/g.572 Transcript_331/m.572 type:complete len:196 (+) Transcript_331:61-648(+)
MTDFSVRISELVVAEDWEELNRLCDESELECAMMGVPFKHGALQMLCCLIRVDLVNARFAWQRAKIRGPVGDEAATWDIARALWMNNQEQARRFVEGHEWNPELIPLVARLKVRICARACDIVRAVYQSISQDRCARLIGTSPEHFLEEIPCDQVEGSDKFFAPRPPVSDADPAAVRGKLRHNHDRTMDQLPQYL